MSVRTFSGDLYLMIDSPMARSARGTAPLCPARGRLRRPCRRRRRVLSLLSLSLSVAGLVAPLVWGCLHKIPECAREASGTPTRVFVLVVAFFEKLCFWEMLFFFRGAIAAGRAESVHPSGGFYSLTHGFNIYS